VKNYFYSKFNSIISAKLIVNQQTGRSKGYAFIEFTNYKEFTEALNLKGQLTFGKQQLVLNSAKNKFEHNEEEKINEISNNEEIKSLNSSTISNQTLPLSSAETGFSSKRNSNEFNNAYNNNYSFFGDKNKNDVNNNIINDSENCEELQTQIKNSLKKLSEQYAYRDNKGSLFSYYCSPFLFKSHKRNNIFFENKDEENINEHTKNDLYIKCPFESCKDK